MTENEQSSSSNLDMNVVVPAVIVAVAVLFSAFLVGGSISDTGAMLSKDIASLKSGLAVAPSDAGNDNMQGDAGAQDPTKPDLVLDVDLSNVADDDPTIGADAPVQIVEFSDFQCLFCRRWYVDGTKEQLETNWVDTGKASFTYRDFPLSFHPMANDYALAGECAEEQGKFWEFHDRAFDEQAKLGTGTITSLTMDDVRAWVADLGMDVDEFNTCLENPAIQSEVNADLTAGQSYKISGTPSFVIKFDKTQERLDALEPIAQTLYDSVRQSPGMLVFEDSSDDSKMGVLIIGARDYPIFEQVLQIATN